ncbi:hypothetical protein DICPUDRAFT_50879 [Dictyostelium purpureum]|uniref:VWFA domain-containing protein n=1 Tax=Dictyostelium purpureum TaxID=5786 RepID=F1A0S7_DICPU|nr:uncharacterized protein DICPUDRAFT_50879 [Dictyostelium purpureum]EGC30201.1 hypothetical protein DICPUDRAFT_50879 [Dictyostelium purpureum]|eukprot:XP_003293264.1 hypothetical protein DICPUDRAFT_50879 [Dictyostelium purpureum]
MGCSGSKQTQTMGHHGGSSSSSSAPRFQAIKDNYQTLGEVQDALRKAGLESSNLILGIDYTKSNTWNGKNTFGGKCLHDISTAVKNPYQEAIEIIGETLSPFDDDNLIPVFGFGDIRTGDKTVFKFSEVPLYGYQEIINKYNEITPLVSLSGPTSFAPIIREAINIVAASKQYHILVIIADGEVTAIKETTQAIIDASNYPLSILIVGVGDGPWDLMEKYDDELPQRKFDNLQFVPFHKTMLRAEDRRITFAVAALQEIPEQFQSIKKLGLL